mgnify:CR=1 FL=1
MIEEIYVKEVIEKNNCAGKKYICVTAMDTDEIISSRFLLTPAYMPPDYKLTIASVSPMDKVKVVYDTHQTSPIIIGEYIDNLSDVKNREPLCRCGTLMVSDGFDIYCPNDRCALTLATRIERLAETNFFKPKQFNFQGEKELFDHHDISVTESLYYQKPFLVIQNGIFWGEPGGSLENVLLKQKMGDISLATFLIQPLFEEFIQERYSLDTFENTAGGNIFNFYSEMDEFINRRDYDCERQNKLIYEFLWCLGIESLSEHHIQKILDYERFLDNSIDPMLVYAYLLTHPKQLIDEIGVHPLEAFAILKEISLRRYEFFDIFSYYVRNQEDISIVFRKLIPDNQI